MPKNALVPYRRRVPARRTNYNTIILLLAAGLIVWLILKSKQGTAMATYQNEETWDIQWSPDGLPMKVTIHRKAVQG